MFSSNIVSFMARSKHSEFENVKYSVKNSRMVFDNFVVNGKNLGKGHATVGIVRTGLFKLVPKLTISNLKLEDVNLDSIYKEKNSQIDTFTEKINSLSAQEKADKTTADFIKETTDKVATLTTNTDSLINSKWRENIEILVTLDNVETARNIGKTEDEIHEGMVTKYIPDLKIPENMDEVEYIVVGPPVMMHFSCLEILKTGIPTEKIWVSFERKMSCAVGKCGHCKIDETYICLEGPVFRYDFAKKLLD